MSDQTSATAAQATAGSVPARALVPMYREAWEANGGPVACDVHPGEVASYRRGGWRVAPVEQPPARAASDRKGGK